MKFAKWLVGRHKQQLFHRRLNARASEGLGSSLNGQMGMPAPASQLPRNRLTTGNKGNCKIFFTVLIPVESRRIIPTQPFFSDARAQQSGLGHQRWPATNGALWRSPDYVMRLTLGTS